MYYVLFTSVVFSLLSTSLLMLVQLLHLQEARMERKHTVQHNLNNGIEWILSDHPPCEMETPALMDLFDEGSDSLAMLRKPWGLFEVAHVTAFIRGDSLNRSFFVGQIVPKEGRTALFLEDHNRPLSLCGNTLIEGMTYLPEAGVKRAYIEGKTFSGEKLVHGEIKTAGVPLPVMIAPEALRELFNYMEEPNSPTLPPDPALPSYQSFKKEILSLVLEAEHLHDLNLAGQIILWSPGRLCIDSTCTLEDVIVIAPSIRVREGFKGSCQFFATDSIVLEKNVQLTYPSAALIRKTHPGGNSQIVLEPQAKVEGVVAMLIVTTRPSAQDLVQIMPGASVEGLVYVEASLNHQGTINGMLYTKKFLLSTPSSVYENHLLDANISSQQLHERFAFPMYTQANGKRALMKWVN